jgi:hypothetical protein
MRTTLLGLAAFAAMTAASLGEASATLLTYDDIGVPNGFVGPFADQGFQFDSGMIVWDVSRGSRWSRQGPAVSGNYDATNDTGGDAVITKVGGGTFSFTGTFIKPAFEMVGGAITGYYLDGTSVSMPFIASKFPSSNGGWTAISAPDSFQNIDQLVISAQFGTFFSLDNTTFDALFAPGPLPGCCGRLGLGFLTLAGVARRLAAGRA